jgi:hypothetical protein
MRPVLTACRTGELWEQFFFLSCISEQLKKKKKHWWHKLFILDDYCKAKLIQKETF